jgi:hypothetical protein
LKHVKADDALINKTEIYLRDKLAENEEHKVFKFSKYRMALMKNVAKVACIVFILVEGGIAKYTYYKTPVSYISLDINPSIEFGVNAYDRVVSAEGYNIDGEKVLIGLNVTGSDVADAISTVVSSAANNGFIENDGTTVISLTSETDNAARAIKLKAQAETGVKEALKEKGKTAVILKDNVDTSFRNEARGLNITPGKLNLIKKLQAVNPVATVDQYRDSKVKDIVKAIQTPDGNNIVYNKEETPVNNKDSIASNNKGQTVTVDKDKDIINTAEGTPAGNKDKTVNNKDEGTANSKNKNTENSKNESSAVNKDKDASKDKEKAGSNIIEENDANSKDKGAVKSKDENPQKNKDVLDNNQTAGVNKKSEDAAGSKKDTPGNGSKPSNKWCQSNGAKDTLNLLVN